MTRPPKRRSPGLEGTGAGNHDAAVNHSGAKDSPTSRPAQHWANHRQAALALLNGDHRLTRKAGQFLGQLAVDPSDPTERQADWLDKLLSRCGLPPLARPGGQ